MKIVCLLTPYGVGIGGIGIFVLADWRWPGSFVVIVPIMPHFFSRNHRMYIIDKFCIIGKKNT